MSTIATLMVKIGADIKELESGISNAMRKVDDAGKRMTEMGKTLSTRVTAPIVALGGLSVRAFGNLERAQTRLRSALQAHGRDVDVLFARYSDFADRMQDTTVVSDDATLAMLGQAEAMGITGDAAERAVRNSIAMQSAFGVNAQSALRYTAALEEGNATMLTRYIPTLRSIEDESERVAEAQRILAGAFEGAEAEANTTIGAMQGLRNELSNVLEDVGEIISKSLVPFLHRIRDIARAFQELDDEVKVRVVSIAAMIGAAGPLLIAVGHAARIITAFAVLVQRQFAIIAGAFILGVGVGQWFLDNWRRIFGGAEEEFTGFIESTVRGLQSIIRPIQNIVMEATGANDILKTFYEAWERVGDNAERAGKNISGAGAATEDTQGEFSQLERASMSASDRLSDTGRMGEIAMSRIREAGGEASNTLNTVNDSTDKVQKSFIGLEMTVAQIFDRLVFAAERLDNVLQSIVRQLASRAVMTALRLVFGGDVGGFAGFLGSVIGVNDALITSRGDIVKFHPDDNILAMKDFSGIGGAQKVIVEGRLDGNDILISNTRSQRFFR